MNETTEIKTYPALFAEIRMLDDIARACEKLARGSLGWVRRDTMQRAIDAGCLNVAAMDDVIVGFILWSNPTRGVNKGFRVVHTLAVSPQYQRRGVGRLLVDDLLLPVRLKCPVTVGKEHRANPANKFYASLGFTLRHTEVSPSGRHLNLWELGYGTLL